MDVLIWYTLRVGDGMLVCVGVQSTERECVSRLGMISGKQMRGLCME